MEHDQGGNDGGEHAGNVTQYEVVQNFELAPQLKRLPSGVCTSLDVSTPAGRSAMYRAMMSPSKGIKDVVNTTIELSDVLVHRAQFTKEDTGELVDTLRIVLILADGSTIACMSQGIAKSLAIYCACFTPPPWPRGVQFRVLNRGQKDRIWYELEAVNVDSVPAKPGVKK